MNNPQEDGFDANELADRLLEQGLREVLQDSQPPDLRARILSELNTPSERKANVVSNKRRIRTVKCVKWLAAAAALIVVCSLMLPQLRRRFMMVDAIASYDKVATDVGSLDGAHPRSVSSLSVVGKQPDTAAPPVGQTASSRSTTGLSAGRGSGAVTRMMQETRLREIEVGGKRIQQSYTVQVPTTVQTTQNYSLPAQQTDESHRRSFSQARLSTLVTTERGERDSPIGLNFGTGEGDPRLGVGPKNRGDQYVRIHENRFVKTEGWQAVSTFSIDVDTASYANVRQMLLESNSLPPPDAVRIEEFINYFDYNDAGPAAAEHAPFASHTEVASCPWNAQHRLVRIGLKGREMASDRRPLSNLVFLVDVSGSMQDHNKLPLVVESLKYMTAELSENDRVAVVVYASAEGLALPSTRGDKKDAILRTLDSLRSGGSTAGGAGIQLAYRVAEEHFIKGGTNRVVLCTDGDFNVGVTSSSELERLAEQKAKETGVSLTVLGFGRGNLNDAMMEKISNKGNGNYHYVDSVREGRRVLVQQMSGTLVTIAKDVKIQVEFNPAQVAAWRLIGYENRLLAREDFDDDTKDAGEIGAGHTVTALYEIVPTGVGLEQPAGESLKYQSGFGTTNDDSTVKPVANRPAADVGHELLTLRIRYKPPTSDTSTKLEFVAVDHEKTIAEASADFKFASAVGSFGMLLRQSQHQGDATFDSVLELARTGAGEDVHGYRAEFLEMVQRAKALKENQASGVD